MYIYVCVRGWVLDACVYVSPTLFFSPREKVVAILLISSSHLHVNRMQIEKMR